MAAFSMLLQMPPLLGQEVVEEPVYDEAEDALYPSEEESGDTYEEPAKSKYSWANEYKYHEETVAVREIDETSRRKAIEGLDYSKTLKPKKKKETPLTPDTPPDLPPDPGDGSFFKWLFRGLLLVAGLVIIVLIVMNIIQMKPAPKDVVIKAQSVENLDLQHIEENLNTADLDPLIQRAIIQENYTMAVRLYYLAILKKLSQHKFVVWKKDKTNRDYLQELNLSSLRQPFQEATRDFEWVWYGDGVVGKQDFERMQGQFQKMLSLIQQNNKP